jgi:hypothetical protein
LKPIQLSISRFFKQLFFSKPKKELPAVALFGQEKIQFFFKMLSISNWAKKV